MPCSCSTERFKADVVKSLSLRAIAMNEELPELDYENLSARGSSMAHGEVKETGVGYSDITKVQRVPEDEQGQQFHAV